MNNLLGQRVIPVLAILLIPGGAGVPARPADAARQHFSDRSDVATFIGEMVAAHGFDRGQLRRWLDQIRSRDDIIAKITRPAEKTTPWHAYRNIFLDRQRIDNGVAFWRHNAATLSAAQSAYGVPAEIIVAILGVETRYGKITGADGVLEALATLAFDYPRRARFFRSELEHYLLLAREEGINPLSMKGSYAGAMGLAQFMPSSYRAYAVDFDGDGRRDLWRNREDAIGSIANYLSKHRWQDGGPIATAAQVKGSAYKSLQSDKLEPPRHSVAKWRAKGVGHTGPTRENEPALLLELEGASGPEHWLGFQNFYVITRYNRSPLYAMAVFQLGQEIKRRYHRE